MYPWNPWNPCLKKQDTCPERGHEARSSELDPREVHWSAPESRERADLVRWSAPQSRDRVDPSVRSAPKSRDRTDQVLRTAPENRNETNPGHWSAPERQIRAELVGTRSTASQISPYDARWPKGGLADGPNRQASRNAAFGWRTFQGLIRDGGGTRPYRSAWRARAPSPPFAKWRTGPGRGGALGNILRHGTPLSLTLSPRCAAGRGDSRAAH
jgi:hypothetical protein